MRRRGSRLGLVLVGVGVGRITDQLPVRLRVPGGLPGAGRGLARAPAGDVASHGQQGPCGCIQSPYLPPAFWSSLKNAWPGWGRKEPAGGASGHSWKHFQCVFEDIGKDSVSWESILLEAPVLASSSAKVAPEHIKAAVWGSSSHSGPDMDPFTPSLGQSLVTETHGWLMRPPGPSGSSPRRV